MERAASEIRLISILQVEVAVKVEISNLKKSIAELSNSRLCTTSSDNSTAQHPTHINYRILALILHPDVDIAEELTPECRILFEDFKLGKVSTLPSVAFD